MSEQFDALQRAFNAVGTAETAWDGYRAACIPEFDIAYGLHGNALQQSRQNIQNREDNGWKTLSLILGVSLGIWVPRFLKPVNTSVDELTSSWINTTLKYVVEKDLEDFIKGTTMETMKKWVSNETTNNYEPVAEKTAIWSARFERGIKDRALIVKQSITELQDSIKTDPKKLSVRTAEKLEMAFRQNCPFVVNQPKGGTDKSVSTFARDSELEMWMQWALARNQSWWTENSRHRDLWDMYPIMDRMFALGVNVTFYHPGKRSATGVPNIRPGYVLDMVKMIEWAQKRWRDANTSKKPMEIPAWLRLRATG